MNIPKDILELHSIFTDAGKELFLVGGCVRDFRLGLEPKDFDMATNAYPNEIEDILKDYHLGLTGKNFGVMRVYTEDEPVGYEIATYREDETVGRKPIVKIGSTIQNDSNRRDFTINALYYNITTKALIDLVDGEKDLNDKIIRACGDPVKRINEDALRMQRAIRFKRKIGGTIEEGLHNAMLANPKLEGPDVEGNIIPISQERIAEEFLKGLPQAANMDLVKEYVQDYFDYGYLDQVFPKLHLNKDFKAESKVPEILIADLIRHNPVNNETLNKLIQDCQLTRRMATGVMFLLKFKDITEDNAYILRKHLDKTDLTMFDILDYGQMLMNYNWDMDLLLRIHAFTKFNLTVDCEDLKKEGFVDGPELGLERENREKENFLKLFKENFLKLFKHEK